VRSGAPRSVAAVLTIACVAVPAIAGVALINYLRPWAVGKALWLLALGILIITLVGVRLRNRPVSLTVLWIALLAVGIGAGWHFYRLRVPALESVLKPGYAHLHGKTETTRAAIRRNSGRELIAYFGSRPSKPACPAFPSLTKDEVARVSAALLEGTFPLGKFPPAEYPVVRIGDRLKWTEDPFGQGYWQILLHSMDYVRTLVTRYQDTGDIRYLVRAENLTFQWIESNQSYLLYPPATEYSWYDTAVAHRARAWTAFWEVWIKSPLADEDKAENLLQAIHFHARRLADPAYYYESHNHGIDQDFGLMVVAATFPEFKESGEWLETARQRLTQALHVTVSPNGVYREHSPNYQLYTLELLHAIQEFSAQHGFSTQVDREIKELLPKMARFSAYLIDPDGTLAPLGDTMPGTAISESHPALQSFLPDDPVLQYAVSRGKAGDPGPPVLVDKQEGYLAMRETNPDGGEYGSATYLLFTATAFPDLGHNQWDDLSFILSAGGRHLLVDPSLFAYEIDREERKYVLSAAAHNTVVVDAASAIGERTRIESYQESEKFWAVRASQENYPPCASPACCRECRHKASWPSYPPLRHQRTMVYVRPDSLFLIDEIGPAAYGSKIAVKHQYDQLFHLAPDLVPRLDPANGDVQVHASEHGPVVLRIEQSGAGRGNIDVITGRKHPLQGWVTKSYGKLVPAPVVRFTATGDEAVFVTRLLIRADERGGSAAGPEPVPHRSQVDAKRIILDWISNDRHWRANVNRTGPVAVELWAEPFSGPGKAESGGTTPLAVNGHRKLAQLKSGAGVNP